MKIRNDFVTNSSSSSFILARKGSLNEKQKEAILAFIEKELLSGESFNEENIDKYFQYNFVSEKKKEKIKTAMQNGQEVFEFRGEALNLCSEDFCSELWHIAEEYGDGNFTIIDEDFGY